MKLKSSLPAILFLILSPLSLTACSSLLTQQRATSGSSLAVQATEAEGLKENGSNAAALSGSVTEMNAVESDAAESVGNGGRNPEGDKDTPILHPLEASAFQKILAEPKAKWLLVNVWATWCLACLEELPEILRLHEAYKSKGLRLLLLSADFEDDRDDVMDVLREHEVKFPTFIVQGEEHEFIDAMNPDWEGNLPATQLRSENGDVLFFREGTVSFTELEAVLKKAEVRPEQG